MMEIERRLPPSPYERIEAHFKGARSALEKGDKILYNINIELIEELINNYRSSFNKTQLKDIRKRISDLSGRAENLFEES